MRKHRLPSFIIAILFLACAALPVRAAAAMNVEVKVEGIDGEEYEKCYAAARKSLGGDEYWVYAKLVDYSLIDAKTGVAVTLDKPVEVDITPKLPGVTPRVVKCCGTDGLRFEEIPVSKAGDGSWHFSIDDSARLFIIGRTSSPYVEALENGSFDLGPGDEQCTFILTTPGTAFNWSLSHRMKDAAGELLLVIIGGNADDGLELQDLLSGYPAGAQGIGQETLRNDGIQIVRITSGSEPHRCSGVYTVPEGQRLTRFMLISLKGYSIVEETYFSLELPPVPEGFARLEIRKTIDGVSAQDIGELKENLKFTVASGDETLDVYGTEFSGEYKEADGWVGTWYADIPAAKASGYTYTVTEDLKSADMDGYERKSFAGTGSEAVEDTATAMTTLSMTDPATVSFRSTYTSSRTLKIRRVSAGNEGIALPGAHFSLAIKGGVPEDVATDTAGEANLGPISYDTIYTLSETSAPDGYLPLEGSVRFRVSADGDVAFCDENGEPVEYSDPYRLVFGEEVADGSDEVVLVMKSLPEYRLPKTGGQTASALYLGAALLLAGLGGGCVYLYYSGRLFRKKRRE